MSKTRATAMVILGLILTLSGLAGFSNENELTENLIVLASVVVGVGIIYFGILLFKSSSD